jgi:2',3'-cyclic-nucleotide 2'-phosphodiesterase (5'-nucleotidase family)
VIFSSGFKFENYSFVSFEVNIDDGFVSVVDFGTNANEGGGSDPMVGELIAWWHEVADAEIMIPIGYLQNPLELGSNILETLVAEVWLTKIFEADIALTHVNSIRDSLPSGDITISDIISVLPFDNRVIQINISGQDALNVLDESVEILATGGLVQEGSTWKLRITGEPIDPSEIYTVLVDEFLYSGGDEFKFHEMDPDGFNTGLNPRQLFINWIIAQYSNSEFPLDEAIANLLDYLSLPLNLNP